eukprot:COSAG04_NODE_5788_length_1493_cov_4.357245_2_plen_85_part_00
MSAVQPFLSVASSFAPSRARCSCWAAATSAVIFPFHPALRVGLAPSVRCTSGMGISGHFWKCGILIKVEYVITPSLVTPSLVTP